MPLRRRLALAALLALVAALVALGVWQLQRRTWKLALIAQVERRLAATPVAVPGPERWAAIGKDDAYTRVVVRGTWRPIRPILAQATTELGGGYWVMAPLDTAEGFTVLVNRGFVRLDDKRDLQAPSGPAGVTGLLRLTEPKGVFCAPTFQPKIGGIRGTSRRSPCGSTSVVPAKAGDPCLSTAMHRPDMGPCLHRGDECAEGTGRHAVAPYFIDADAVPGQPWPRGGLTVVRFPNNHLVYALTWFAMAALLAFATWRVAGARRDA